MKKNFSPARQNFFFTLAVLFSNLNLIFALTSQTISFSSIGNKAANATPFTITATAQSGLAVTFAVTTGSSFASVGSTTLASGVSTATVTLSGTAIGTVTITASQAGDVNFSAAPNVSKTFSVTALSNTITYAAITNKTIVGGVPSSVNFTQLATVTNGTVSHASSNTSVATVNSGTGAVTIVGPGSVTLTASATASSSIYAAPVSVARTFIVYASPNTITYPVIANKTIVGGMASSVNFTQLATVTDGTVAHTSSNTAVATVVSATGAVTIVGPGTVNITASATPSSSNFATPVSVTRTFIVYATANTITYPVIADKTIIGGVPSSVNFTQMATATNGTISHNSSNAAVATVVSGTGAVTIVGPGTVTITASAVPTSTGYATPSPVARTFIVYASANTITYPVISNKTIIGGVPSSVNFTQLATVTDGTIAHTSSNTAVATVVSATGAVTIVGPGTVTITASATPSSVNFSTPVSVARTFTVSASTNTITYPAISNKTIIGGDLSTADFTQLATVTNGTIAHTSSNTAVATVISSTGDVSIMGVGTVTITASATPSSVNFATPASVARTFTVYASTNTIIYPVISNKTIVGGVPSSADFTQLATVDDGVIHHTSSNTAVVTVNDATGEVTIVGPGTVTITASATSVVAEYVTPTPVARTFTVYASPNTITYATIANKTIVGGVPSSANFTQLATATDGTVAHTSSNTAVATVVSGTGAVTIVGPGTVTITASATPSSVNFATPTSVARTFTVYASANTITYPAIANKTIIGGVPSSVNFTQLATVTNGTVAHTSSNTAVATVVSGTGAVTIVGPGTVTITASATPSSANYVTPTSVTRTFTVLKSTNTITYAAIVNRLMTDGNFTQLATVTNGTVSHASSNTAVATVNASTGAVTIVAAGTVTLTASATPASANYATPVSVARTFTISKTSQTITWTAISSLTASAFVASPITASATASSGLMVTYSVASGPATASGATITSTGVSGTVVLRATQAGNTIYASKTQDLSFVVTAGKIHINNPAQRLAQPKESVDNFIPSAEFSIFPNPYAGGLINVRSENAINSIYVFDMTGRMVATETFEMPSTLVNADLEKLPAGIYFLQINSNAEQFQKLLLIE